MKLMKPSLGKLRLYIHQNFSNDDFLVDKILSAFMPKETQKNELLLKKGDVSHYCYFVENGILRMFYEDKKGSELTRYFATEGTFGGGFASFINQEPSVEFVQSIGVSKLWIIERRNFYDLVKHNSLFALLYIDILEKSYSYSIKRIGTFMAMEANERIEWIFKYQPALLQQVPNRIIASYLGIKPQTFSRLLSKSSHK
jgi:CRP-like cAMP-binding protein